MTAEWPEILYMGSTNLDHGKQSDLTAQISQDVILAAFWQGCKQLLFCLPAGDVHASPVNGEKFGNWLLN